MDGIRICGFVTVLVCGLALCVPAEERGKSGAALLMKAFLPDGGRADAVQFTLWRKIPPAASGDRPSECWEDKTTGELWTPCGHTQTRFLAAHKDIEPGVYRVSCGTVGEKGCGDPTPYGLSDAIHVDKDAGNLTADVHLEGGAPLTLSFIDADAREPVPRAAVTLFREDGLPVGHGSGGFQRTATESGVAEYNHLATGTYSLRVDKRAWRVNDKEYEVVENFLVKVEAGKRNAITVPMRPKTLSQEDIDKRWPFIVEGRITGMDGAPMEGVKVRANCGIGTLFPTGDTLSGSDGRYRLRFTGGMRMKNDDGSWSTGLQAATIYAEKPDYCERNLCRQGNLGIADQKPTNENTGWIEEVIPPLQPYTLDFVMAPAASIRGFVVDGDGEPVTGVRVMLDGDELPPSTSVLAQTDVDERGKFAFGSVPCREFWFALRGEKPQ